MPDSIRLPLSGFQLKRIADLTKDISTLQAMRDGEVKMIVAGHADPETMQVVLDGTFLVCTPTETVLHAPDPEPTHPPVPVMPEEASA